MKNDPVPRYVVRLPDGEVELDALEIFALFRSHKVDFQTLVRPVEGGDWRKISEEKTFAPTLPFLYSLGRSFWWLPGFSLLFLAFPLLLLFWDRGLGWWPLFCLKNSAMWAICLLSFFRALELFPLNNGFSAWRLARMMIPWWNSVEGYRFFQDCAAELPPRSARFLRCLNPFVWISLAIFYGSFFLASPDTVGGRWIFACYGIFWLLLCLSSIPISRELKRRDDAWRTSNPKPPKSKEKSPLWSKFKNREFVRSGVPDVLRFLLCLMVAALVFLIPWRIIGEIRWDRAVKYELPALPEPHAAPELEKIVLPEISIRTIEFLQNRETVPADIRTELKKVEPQLNAIREILWKYPTLGLRRIFHSEQKQPIDLCNAKLREYLRWRRLELRTGGDFRALLRDLERRAEYAAEEPTFGIFHLELETRMKIIAGHLCRFSDEELAQEKVRWQKLAALSDSVISGNVLAQNAQVTEMLIPDFNVNVFNRILLFFFADSLRATFLEYSRELTDILSRDAWQSRNDFRKFQTRMGQLGGIHWMWASFLDRAEKISEASDGETLPVSPQFNRASRLRAVCRLAESGIELEQYRRRHGHFSEKPDLPKDPFDGKPLRYLPGRALYSVDSDLKDDNGREWGRDNPTSDIVFPLEEGKR